MTQETEKQLRKWTTVTPSNPGIRFAWYYGDDDLVIQFVMTISSWNTDTYDATVIPLDLGYHSRTPRYEGQEPMGHCSMMTPCYYDGSSLQAMDLAKAFFSSGEDVVWSKLQSVFEGMKAEDRKP